MSKGPSKSARERRHDIVGALRSLRFLVESLEQGYKFDDALAAEKIRRIKQAVATLENEEATLLGVLADADE